MLAQHMQTQRSPSRAPAHSHPPSVPPRISRALSELT
jgi:hypothetical protein